MLHQHVQIIPLSAIQNRFLRAFVAASVADRLLYDWINALHRLPARAFAAREFCAEGHPCLQRHGSFTAAFSSLAGLKVAQSIPNTLLIQRFSSRCSNTYQNGPGQCSLLSLRSSVEPDNFLGHGNRTDVEVSSVLFHFKTWKISIHRLILSYRNQSDRDQDKRCTIKQAGDEPQILNPATLVLKSERRLKMGRSAFRRMEIFTRRE